MAKRHASTALVAATHDRISAVRAAACQALGCLGVPATDLARSLDDPHAEVRKAAAKALGSLSGAGIAMGQVSLTEKQKGEIEEV